LNLAKSTSKLGKRWYPPFDGTSAADVEATRILAATEVTATAVAAVGRVSTEVVGR
jgi:hypothetical protein